MVIKLSVIHASLASITCQSLQDQQPRRSNPSSLPTELVHEVFWAISKAPTSFIYSVRFIPFFTMYNPSIRIKIVLLPKMLLIYDQIMLLLDSLIFYHLFFYWILLFFISFSVKVAKLLSRKFEENFDITNIWYLLRVTNTIFRNLDFRFFAIVAARRQPLPFG